MASASKSKGRYWPWLLGGLMALVLGANFVLMYFATSDPSFAVEENYYQKAQAWDEKRKQDRRNEVLGWTLDLEVARERSPDGGVGLTAVLTDSEGRKITDAAIRLATFHNARAAYVMRAELKPAPDGDYRASLPLRRPGLWEFRFEVSRDGEQFTYTTMQELFWRR